MSVAAITAIEEACSEAQDEMLCGSDYYDEPVVPVKVLLKIIREA